MAVRPCTTGKQNYDGLAGSWFLNALTYPAKYQPGKITNGQVSAADRKIRSDCFCSKMAGRRLNTSGTLTRFSLS
jgi:hypothetical protein